MSDRNKRCDRCGRKRKRCTCQNQQRQLIRRTILIALSLLLAGGLLWASTRNAPPRPSTDVHPWGKLVPPRKLMFKVSMRGAPNLPRVNKAQIYGALDFIIGMDGATALTTEDDYALLALARSYKSKARPFSGWLARGVVTDTGGKPATARAVYSCVGDYYLVDPTLQPTTPLLAATLYHEFQHAVECHQLMAKLGITDSKQMEGRAPTDRCLVEPRAHAAQVRFVLALHQSGKMPTHISVEDDRDASLLHKTREVWDALLQNRFCQWYTAALRRGGTLETDPRELFNETCE